MQQFTSIRLSNLLDALQSFGFSPKIPFLASNSSPSTFRGKEVRLFLLFLNACLELRVKQKFILHSQYHIASSSEIRSTNSSQ